METKIEGPAHAKFYLPQSQPTKQVKIVLYEYEQEKPVVCVSPRKEPGQSAGTRSPIGRLHHQSSVISHQDSESVSVIQ